MSELCKCSRMLSTSELCKCSWLKCGMERSFQKTGEVTSCKRACGGVRSDLSSAAMKLLRWPLL